jgi:hypothetical protein
VIRKADRRVAATLWAIYGVLAVAGLALLAEALFVRRDPELPAFAPPSIPSPLELRHALPPPVEALANRRMTRKVAARPSQAAAIAAAPPALESLVHLTGILDFGGKSPSVAVIETPTETKGYRPGDSVGSTGALVRSVTDYVILEFEKKRYKLTFKGMEELPAKAVGDAGGHP